MRYGVEVEEAYFDWLCHLMRAENEDIPLLMHLYHRNFEYPFANDMNRAQDGIDLRGRFLFEEHCESPLREGVPCSILEMLVALAVRCDREITGVTGEDRPQNIFWMMIDNLGLKRAENWYEVDMILDIWMRRKYQKDGKGGLFPLKKSSADQRKVEIWYQMGAWIYENFDDLK